MNAPDFIPQNIFVSFGGWRGIGLLAIFFVYIIIHQIKDKSKRK